MSEQELIIQKENSGLAKIILNCVERHNAFDDKLIAELTENIKQLDKDPKVKVISLSANGKSFSAGADLNWMKRMADYAWQDNYQDSLLLAELMRCLYECRKITLAIVQGNTFGGGVGLTACCDIVLASKKAKFCLSEVKLGLIPAVIGPYVVKAIGQRYAKRYFTTAEIFSAEQAYQMQLVHQVFPHEQLTEEANKLIEKILSNAPQAVLLSKQLINLVDGQAIDKKLIEETARLISDTRASAEGKEGVSAFLEKRSANWISKQDE